MKYYIELTLLPSEESPIYFLWEKVYQQIHLALVEIQDEEKKVSIGVAFPEYNEKQFQLGAKLRIFGNTRDQLTELKIDHWLSRLKDYIHIKEIKEVPENCEYAFYRRIQTKSSNTRMARRKAKREGISFEEAMSYLNNRLEEVSRVPYVHAKSLSSEKRYKLMISQQNSKKKISGKFSTYGLSSTSTVPVF